MIFRQWSGVSRSRQTMLTAVLMVAFFVGQAAAHSPYPIVFVHGLFGNQRSWEQVRPALINNGIADRAVLAHFSVNADQDYDYSYLPGDTAFVAWSDFDRNLIMPNGDDRLFMVNFDRRFFPAGTGHSEDTYSNTMAIMKTGAALGNIIDRILSLPGQEADKVILIGHSMGGLTIRDYLQRTDDNGNHRFWDDNVGHRVAMVSTLATPHHGSMYLAYVGFEPNEIDENWLGVRSAEATRDLRTYHFTGLFNTQHMGVYLFGGQEGNASGWGLLSYDNKDVNCDGVEGGYVEGVSYWVPGSGTIRDNPDMPLPEDIPYRWVTSVSEYNPASDGVVRLHSQWLQDQGQPVPAFADTVLLDTEHIPVHDDRRAVFRGLDEPDEALFAYEIPVNLAEDEWVSGRFTFPPYYNPQLPVGDDVDQYRFTAVSTGNATLRMTYFDWSDSWSIEVRDLATNELVIEPVTAQNNPNMDDVSVPVVVGEEYLVTVTGKALRDWGDPYFFAVDAAFPDPELAVSSLDDSGLPDSPMMVSASPNPFNAQTRISFDLPVRNRVTVHVYDVLGQQVAQLQDGVMNEGSHSFDFDAGNLGSGVYFVDVYTGTFGHRIHKITLLK